ncbi:hypothetical protein Tco_1229205 [Tanacetum coccineum]
MFSLTKAGEGVVWANWAGSEGPSREPVPIGMPSPTDGAKVEANLRRPVGLSKWASIFVIVWFSLAPPDSSPSVNEAVAGLVLLLRHDTSDSGPDMSFDTSASLGYVSGLGHASLSKVFSQVSPSVVPDETIPHHLASLQEGRIIK